MYAVGRLGSYISRGVYSVSGPFHPFGGAVDIIVIEQPDGTFKSSPWYVRFGKFQGVLKTTKEKIVNISVNGVEATSFHMYLDHKGEAYFLKEITEEGCGEEEDFSSSSSSDGQSSSNNNSRPRQPNFKSRSFNYDDDDDISRSESGALQGRVAEFRRSRILGLVFGRQRSMKEERFQTQGEVGRVDSLERAEIAADLLDLNWSTSLATKKKKRKDVVGSSFLTPHDDDDDDANLDGTAAKADRVVLLDDDNILVPESNIDLSFDLTNRCIIGISSVGLKSVEGSSQEKSECKQKLDGLCGEEMADYCFSAVGRIGSSSVNCETSESSNVRMEFLASTEQHYSDTLALGGGGEAGVVHLKTILAQPQMLSQDVTTTGKDVNKDPNMKWEAASAGHGHEAHEDVSIADDADGEFKIYFENKHCAGDFDSSEPSNAPPASESSEEIQFIFSDLDDSKLDQEELSKPLFRQGGAELSDDADERLSDTSLDNKETKSSSVNIISTSHTLLHDTEFERLVESMPNIRSHIENLESYLVQVPLSQSLDINSKTLEFIKDEEDHLARHQLNIAGTEGPSPAENIHVGPSLVEQALNEDSSKVMAPAIGSWRLWPFSFNKSRSAKVTHCTGAFIDVKGDNGALKPKVVKKMVRLTTPISEQLASLNLKEGSNSVTFSFSTSMLGKQQVEARIYFWKWSARIIISDVDGTITKSDVLGQFMPLVGMDWSQTGVAHLFSAIKENGYQMLFLSARAISQAYHTRQFLFNLKQNGKCLPEGPVVISPDGLFPSLYREVIRRAPHEFKIACLEDIKALFPPDCNPFYAGFGNRDTDEISYLKVGIPKGKIFIINPKGQVAVNRHINTKSYTSLHALVHGMFPHASTSHEQEAYNSWNYWKLPPPEIDI